MGTRDGPAQNSALRLRQASAKEKINRGGWGDYLRLFRGGKINSG
jgi:hypothetical protein